MPRSNVLGRGESSQKCEFFLRRRFTLHRETNLQKSTEIFYKICIRIQWRCNIKYTCRKSADNLTSIIIGPSCTTYIVLMIDRECQQKLNAQYTC